ncbi:MAG: hypothetical protein WC981_01165 [Candidatus Dojkabacteria bacterium]|jgi:hypothetical protein
MGNKKELSKFRPILPARYNTAAYMEWRKKFFHFDTDYPVSYFERLDLSIRTFLIYSSLECLEDRKVPLIILSREITPNLSLNFPIGWFRDFFGTLKQLKVAGVIITDMSEEGEEINKGIKEILEEEKNKDWMVESIENFEGVEGVCDKYIEKIEHMERFNIEYKENR